MNSLRILRLLFLFSALLAFQYVAEARQQIAVSPSTTNNYTIPPEQAGNTIRFEIAIPGEKADLPYRYISTLDGQNAVARDLGTKAVGLVLDDNRKYFTYGIGHGLHTVSVTLQKQTVAYPETWEYVSSASTTVTLTQYHRVTVQTSYGGGTLYIDGVPKASGDYVNVPKYTTHTISINDWQYVDGHYRKYRRWYDHANNNRALDPQLSFAALIDNNVTFTAACGTQLYVLLQSQFVFSTISYDGIPLGFSGWLNPFDDDPSSHQIAVSPTSEDHYGLNFTFANWSQGSTIISTSASTTIHPTADATYTAVYNIKPLPPTNAQAGGSIGQYVTVTWADNPNPTVTQYQIWRDPKGEPAQLVASVGSNVGYWQDPSYKITGTGSDNLLLYSVCCVYAPTGALSDPAVAVTSASNVPEPRLSEGGLKFGIVGLREVPKDYAVVNFPNPFNPSTNISYQLVEQANVTLEVFDMMGRKLQTLVNQEKRAGYYTSKWYALDNDGKQLATGVYFYRLTAIPLTGGKPFIASGKLLLTK